MPINKQIKIKGEKFSNGVNFKNIILDYLMYKLNISNNDLHNLKNETNINIS